MSGIPHATASRSRPRALLGQADPVALGRVGGRARGRPIPGALHRTDERGDARLRAVGGTDAGRLGGEASRRRRPARSGGAPTLATQPAHVMPWIVSTTLVVGGEAGAVGFGVGGSPAGTRGIVWRAIASTS